uniref:Putative secreted peptide n=1 Tax=Anopheles braziliensis TaxID=58242 RepID=A0A2M3ZRD6_9DIPT
MLFSLASVSNISSWALFNASSICTCCCCSRTSCCAVRFISDCRICSLRACCCLVSASNCAVSWALRLFCTIGMLAPP